MHAQILTVALAGLASTVSGNLLGLNPVLDARATGFGCTTAALSILGGVPTPTGRLYNALSSFAITGNIANPTVLCKVTDAIPTQLSAQFTSWEADIASWYSVESSEIGALVSSCTNDPIINTIAAATSGLQAFTASGCAKLVTSQTTTTSATIGVNTTTVHSITSTTAIPTTTSASVISAHSSTTTKPSSSASTGAAAKPTGVYAGAAAVAGFLGVVAMM